MKTCQSKETNQKTPPQKKNWYIHDQVDIIINQSFNLNKNIQLSVKTSILLWVWPWNLVKFSDSGTDR